MHNLNFSIKSCISTNCYERVFKQLLEPQSVGQVISKVLNTGRAKRSTAKVSRFTAGKESSGDPDPEPERRITPLLTLPALQSTAFDLIKEVTA